MARYQPSNNNNNTDIAVMIDILYTCMLTIAYEYAVAFCLLFFFASFILNFHIHFSIMLSSFRSLVADTDVYIIVDFVTLLYSEYGYNLNNNSL